MKLTFEEILLIGIIILLLYHFHFEKIEGLVTLYTENTPRWMKLVADGTSIKPEAGYTGTDFSPHLIAPDDGGTRDAGGTWRKWTTGGGDSRLPQPPEPGGGRSGVPSACPEEDRPSGCGTLFEPHLNVIPRGYPDIFADQRDSGSIDGEIIRPALDPGNLEFDGQPFTENQLDRMRNFWARYKTVMTCGSNPHPERRRVSMSDYDVYKCDYDENNRLTYIKEN